MVASTPFPLSNLFYQREYSKQSVKKILTIFTWTFICKTWLIEFFCLNSWNENSFFFLLETKRQKTLLIWVVKRKEKSRRKKQFYCFVTVTGVGWMYDWINSENIWGFLKDFTWMEKMKCTKEKRGKICWIYMGSAKKMKWL